MASLCNFSHLKKNMLSYHALFSLVVSIESVIYQALTVYLVSYKTLRNESETIKHDFCWGEGKAGFLLEGNLEVSVKFAIMGILWPSNPTFITIWDLMSQVVDVCTGVFIAALFAVEKKIGNYSCVHWQWGGFNPSWCYLTEHSTGHTSGALCPSDITEKGRKVSTVFLN
jgi:hypothetical protein